MKVKKNMQESNCVGNISGFQLPVGLKKKKKKIKEMLELNESLTESEALSYFSGLDEQMTNIVEKMLDENDYVKLAEMIRNGYIENAIREVIRNRIKEIVRKKEGGGGYVLYAPNKGKRKSPKAVGEFPTRAAAKRAELERFPPHEQDKLKKMRKHVDKLRKHPEKAAEKEKEWMRGPKKGKRVTRKRRSKKESVDRLVGMLVESIFREEKDASVWDEYISRLSKEAVLADKKLQGFQKNIAKKSESVLRSALGRMKKSLSAKGFRVDDSGVKKDVDKHVLYAEFTVADENGTAEVGPFYLKMENGYPKIEHTNNSKAGLTRLEPDRNKELRAEMSTFQEDDLDNDASIASVIAKRDAYLDAMEQKLDKLVSGFSSLEITMLKNLLVKKYRKIS